MTETLDSTGIMRNNITVGRKADMIFKRYIEVSGVGRATAPPAQWTHPPPYIARC